MRWALDELRREGKIVRQVGVGTFVADPASSVRNNSGNGHAIATDSRTVVAITKPDRSFFDRAVHLLAEQVEAAYLGLTCHLFNPALGLPMGTERPLGYIVFRRDLLPVAQQLQRDGHQVVLVGTPYADVAPNVPVVQSNQERGGYLATRHLLDLGHRRITFRAPLDLTQTQRYRGHERALAEARKQGHQVEATYITDEQYTSWLRSHDTARAYFASPDAPTAIVAWNDHEGMLLLGFFSYIGIRVPDQVSIIGYDNLPEGEKTHPALTTVDSAVEDQIQAALEILTSDTPCPPNHTVIVRPTLIRRDSSAPLQV